MHEDAEARQTTAAGALTSRHFVLSLLSLGAGQAVSWVGTLVLVVILPRSLGDVNLGRLGFALALTSLTGLLADMGTSTYLMREVARDPRCAAELTGTALLMRLVLGLAAAGVSDVFVSVGRYDETTRAVVFVLSAGIVVGAFASVVAGALQGLHRMRILALLPAVSNTLYVVGAAVLLHRVGGPVVVAMASVAGPLVSLAVATAILVREVPLRPRSSVRLVRRLLAGGLPFLVWQASLVVYGQVDTVLLSILTSSSVVGWYVAANRITSVAMFFPSILITVLYPALSSATSSPRLFDVVLRRALRSTIMVCLPMALGLMLLADRLIALLRYPASFGHSVAPIVVLAPGLPVVAVDIVIGTALGALGRQRRWAMVGVAAAVLNPLANLAAIPLTQSRLGNGGIGAAAVAMATELFMLVNGLRLLPDGAFDRHTLVRCVKTVAAGAIMVIVVVPLRGLPLAVPVTAGALAYVISLMVFGAVSAVEIRALWRELTSRTAPREASSHELARRGSDHGGAGRNVMGDDGAGSDHRAVPDGDALQDDRPGADPDAIPDSDRPVHQGPAANGMLISVHDQHVPPDRTTPPDGHLLPGDDLDVAVEECLGTDGEPRSPAHVESDACGEEAVSRADRASVIHEPRLGESGAHRQPARSRETPREEQTPESVAQGVATEAGPGRVQ